MLMSQPLLVALNEAARSAGAAFVLSVNMGVSTSIFSDFGPKHIISDEDGEPTQMLAVSAAELVPVSNIVKAELVGSVETCGNIQKWKRAIELTFAEKSLAKDLDDLVDLVTGSWML